MNVCVHIIYIYKLHITIILMSILMCTFPQLHGLDGIEVDFLQLDTIPVANAHLFTSKS